MISSAKIDRIKHEVSSFVDHYISRMDEDEAAGYHPWEMISVQAMAALRIIAFVEELEQLVTTGTSKGSTPDQRTGET